MKAEDPRALVLVSSTTKDWLSATIGCIKQLVEDDPKVRVTVLDCTAFFPPLGFGLGVDTIRDFAFAVGRDFEFLRLERLAKSVEFCGILPTSFRTLTQSHVHSILRSQDLKAGPIGKLLDHVFDNEAREFARALGLQIEGQAYDFAVVPNGRYALPQIAQFLFARAGINVMFLEYGWGKRVLLSQKPPHNLPAYAEEISQWPVSEEGIRDAENWLHLRTQAKSNDNKFANFKGFEVRKFKAAFFSSSQDEYEALGRDWESGWENQFNALDYLIRFFGFKGPEVMVRIHPNTLNKPMVEQRKVLASIRWLRARHSGIVIADPGSLVNSYSLAANSEFVFTNGSTIGLESLFLDRRVVSTNPCLWGAVTKTPFSLDGSGMVEPDFQDNRRREAVMFVARFKSRKRYEIPPIRNRKASIFFAQSIHGVISSPIFFLVYILARLKVETSAAMARRLLRWEA